MTPERNTAVPVDDEQFTMASGCVAADPATYQDVQDLKSLPDGARVEQNSRDWAARFFSAGANPYNQTATPRGERYITRRKIRSTSCCMITRSKACIYSSTKL